jgi:FG-GAP-like repeat
VLLLAGCGASEHPAPHSDTPPTPAFCFDRHVIDDSGSGADGVHVGDVNEDGFPDVVSGWEESAELKLYLHPCPAISQSGTRWASVDVSGGEPMVGIEDAAFADLDGDGKPEAIVSATEGEGDDVNRRIRVHRRDRAGVLWYENRRCL